MRHSSSFVAILQSIADGEFAWRQGELPPTAEVDERHEREHIVTQAEYVRTKNILFSTVGLKVLAVNIESGQSYGFNDTASAIWEMLATPQSVPAICAAIEDRFDVDPEECRIEIERLLGEMVRDEMVSVSIVGARED